MEIFQGLILNQILIVFLKIEFYSSEKSIWFPISSVKLFGKCFLFLIPKDLSDTEYNQVKASLQNFDQIINVVYDTRKRPSSQLDYNNNLKSLITDVSKANTISVILANPYTIAGLPGIEKSKSIIVGYQNSVEMENSAAKVVLGKLKSQGKLPVSVNSFFKYGDGL